MLDTRVLVVAGANQARRVDVLVHQVLLIAALGAFEQQVVARCGIEDQVINCGAGRAVRGLVGGGRCRARALNGEEVLDVTTGGRLGH